MGGLRVIQRQQRIYIVGVALGPWPAARSGKWEVHTRARARLATGKPYVAGGMREGEGGGGTRRNKGMGACATKGGDDVPPLGRSVRRGGVLHSGKEKVCAGVCVCVVVAQKMERAVRTMG